jgi:oligoendopeptidase F
MTLLRRAGVDLDRPEPVQAVVAQLGALVDQLEEALAAVR